MLSRSALILKSVFIVSFSLNLGHRYGQIFHDLLGPPFSVSLQEYRYTNKQRTKLSAEMFAMGSLGRQRV